MGRRILGVFVPGMLGSTLHIKGSKDSPEDSAVWSEEFTLNYELLRKSPALLTWGASSAHPTGLLRTARVLGLPARPIYDPLLAYLHGRAELLAGHGLLEFSYDWRESIPHSAMKLRETIRDKYDRDPSLPLDDLRLLLVGHSMGGLVLRAAVGAGHIHPTNIGAFISIGAPYGGSPKAFAAAHGRIDGSMLAWIFRVMMRRPRAQVVLESFSHCVRSFPSVYEVMPPAEAKFLKHRIWGMHSPFQDGHKSAFDGRLRSRVRNTHKVLNQGRRKLRDERVPACHISGLSSNRRTDQTYCVRSDGHAYQVLEPCPDTYAKYGDGTVSTESSGDARAGEHIVRLSVPAVDHDTLCAERRTIKLVEHFLRGEQWQVVMQSAS
jgi:hypothetical protein